MPTPSVTSVPFSLSTPGEWVLLEEIWNSGLLDSNRQLEVPTGARVTIRHNFMWPFWVWEQGLGVGTHNFFIPDGWNKYQVRLDSADSAVVFWIL